MPRRLEQALVTLFSVLIAAYQAHDTLSETLDSLLAQTNASWEAIVADDGSSDGTGQIAEAYAAADPRIRLVRQDNAGAALARNNAATLASGRWLVALDADDLLVPQALDRQARFIGSNPAFELYSWAAWKQLPSGERMPFDDSDEYRQKVSFTLADLVERNRILSSTCIEAGLFARLGGYRDVYTEDYDLWLRALLAGARHLHNPELLTVYRMREASKTTDAWRNMSGTAEVLESLAGNADAPAAVTTRARERAAYWRAWAARTELELRLEAGEWRPARGLAAAAASTFPPGWRSRFGRALLVASPWLYRRYKVHRAGVSR